MKVYNLLKRSDNIQDYNFNLLPFISFFFGNNKELGGKYCLLNIGWFNICLQFKIK